MSTVARIALAVVVGIATYIVLKFLGGAMGTVDIEWVSYTGSFIEQWAGVISFLAAVWYFFKGNGWPFNRSA